MTVKELRKELEDYPSDMECKLVFKKYCIERLDEIIPCVDSDSNVMMCLLCGDGNMGVYK